MRKKLSLILTSVFLSALVLMAGCSRNAQHRENKQFESYTRDLFCQEVASTTIGLHYTLKDPSAYGIKDVPVSLGSCTTDTTALCAAAENAVIVLHSYDRSKLSGKNRMTYDILDDYLEKSLKEASYALYEEPLAPLTGTQAQLPVLLSEYQFADKNDIDIYLELLTKTPGYFQSIADFERAKSQNGLFMASYTADAIVKECNAFIAMGDNNYLYSSFAERLEGMDLSDDEYNSYIKKNQDYIKEYIFPAYGILSDTLNALRATGKNNNGLCYYPNGDEYYEMVVQRETGSNRSIADLKNLTQAQMLEDLTAMQQVLTGASQETFSGTKPSLENADPAAILTELERKLGDSFPKPPKVNTQIKYVQKSMEEYLSPAFYMVPAIDSTTENVIYINQGHLPDDISLYTTLAHEGYPGHLYQTVYYQSCNPDPIRSLLNYGGYTEGWATYSEMMSYYYASIPKEQAVLLQRNTSVMLGIYALADIGIHYEGWTLLDAVTFFRQYGITDTNTIENIYDLIIADPANYLKYYIGYLEFLELKKDAIEQWGDKFTQKKFHKAVLEAGPAPFDILRTYIF